MAQSLGLRLYVLAKSALAGAAVASPPPPPRPDGPLIWLNAPGTSSARAIAELIRRITADRDDLSFLVTHPSDTPLTGPALTAQYPRGTLLAPLPPNASPRQRPSSATGHPISPSSPKPRCHPP